jgi:hypothetical protein
MVIVLGAVGFLLTAGAALLGYLAVRQFGRASRLGTPLARTAKLKPGPCKKVRGKIVAVGKPLRGPLTGQACVYYRLRIDEEHRKWKTTRSAPQPGFAAAVMLGGALGGLLYGLASRDNEGETKVIHSWKNVLNDAQSIRLAVEDASGKVEVDLGGAEVVTKQQSLVHADLNHPAPPRLTDMVRKRYRVHTVDEAGRVKTMRFEEAALQEGAKVTVVGPVSERSDGALCFESQGGALLISERDVGKEGRSARNWAIGLAAAAGGCLVLALGVAVAAAVLVR